MNESLDNLRLEMLNHKRNNNLIVSALPYAIKIVADAMNRNRTKPEMHSKLFLPRMLKNGELIKSIVCYLFVIY